MSLTAPIVPFITILCALTGGFKAQICCSDLSIRARLVYHQYMTNHQSQADRKPKSESSPAARLVSLLLLALALGLAVMAFFALQEILLALGARLIAAGGGGDSIRQRYSLVALRNVGAIGGGGLLIVWVIGGVNYFTRRLDRPESQRRLLWILALEMLIIGLNAAIAS